MYRILFHASIKKTPLQWFKLAILNKSEKNHRFYTRLGDLLRI